MANTATSINGIRFRNPVLPAAGPNVMNAEMMMAAQENGAAGIVSKTVSARAAQDPRPNVRRISNRGLMNCETWAESKPEDFIEELKKVRKQLNQLRGDRSIPLIVSMGYKPEEIEKLGRQIEAEVGPEAFEFSTHYTGSSIGPLVEVAEALRKAVNVPIWMKLSPGFPDIEKLALRVSPLVDAFVAINSFGPVLDFDINNPVPLIGSANGSGWMSGSPILPIALRIVHLLSSVQNKPVIGVGGISCGADAIKFIMAGAALVQVCSAAIINGHSIYGKIASEIDAWLEYNGYSSLEEIRGLFSKRLGKAGKFGNHPLMSIDEEKCTGCRACINRCVHAALSMDGKKKIVAVNNASCIGCGFCQDYCSFDAMRLK